MYKISGYPGVYFVVLDGEIKEDINRMKTNPNYGKFEISDYKSDENESANYKAYSDAMRLVSYLNGGGGNLPPQNDSRPGYKLVEQSS